MPRNFENRINIPRVVTSILTKNTWIHLVSKATDKSKIGKELDITKGKKIKSQKGQGLW